MTLVFDGIFNPSGYYSGGQMSPRMRSFSVFAATMLVLLATPAWAGVAADFIFLTSAKRWYHFIDVNKWNNSSSKREEVLTR